MIIKEIKIQNFRSIVKTDIKLNDVSIFVGLNDVGKSNALKALNLFFNSETDYEKKLNFEEDYCKYSPIRKNKAKEIIVELILQAPKNYQGSKDIIYRKVWRREGEYEDGSPFIKRSRISAWLNNIRYMYVPAIKDSNYFKELLAKLHDCLAETIEVELRNAGNDFIDKIKSNTFGMISEINRRLELSSQIMLPTNLQSLFKTLDFSIDEGNFQVPLDNRGDGIKTRHISLILNFIAEQLNVNKRRVSPNVSMIWGYEEPENNLEMLASFKLAEEFIDYSNQIQILLTTHSPGFYSLKNKYFNKTNLYKVKKEVGNEAAVGEVNNLDELDQDMGIMPIITSYIQAKAIEINELKKSIDSLKAEITLSNLNVLFVEGKDEVRIYDRIIQDLGLSSKLQVKDENLNGCGGVKSEMMSFSWISPTTKLKAMGIFDSDESGKKQYDELIKENQFATASQKGKIKAIKYPVPIPA